VTIAHWRATARTSSGINVGAPTGHGPSVVRGLDGYIDVFHSADSRRAQVIVTE
jgi:hypothetical protein